MRSELSRHGQRRGLAVGMPVAAIRKYYAVLGALLAAILVLLADTFLSMARTWANSDTFLHGVLIFPISAWLISLRRHELARMRPSVFYPGAAVLLLLSLSWWFADVLGVLVAQQLSVVAMICLAVVTVMGPRFAARISFPLGYLFFAVPVGEILVPYLIDYTATFTVKALSITGIPVLRDGRYFSIPSGNFEIARACSGIRYLLAALALGTLFAYTMFHDLRKRLIFILFSIVMPIVANGLRAYAIVMIAEFVSVDFAVGVDHVIFGWIFFGLIIGLMFFIGSKFSDHPPNVATTPPVEPDATQSDAPVRSGSLLAALTLSAVCVASGPSLAAYSAQSDGADRAVAPWLPATVPNWSATGSLDGEWRPRFAGADLEEFGRYVNATSVLDVAVIHYSRHDQGGELANSENRIADADWRMGNQRTVDIPLPDGASLSVTEIIFYDTSAARAAWYWYSVDGRHALSGMQIKLLEAASLLRGLAPLSSVVIISTDLSADIDETRAVLQRFVNDFFAPMARCMHATAALAGCGLTASPETG